MATQLFINEMKIKPENIINVDQIPRYFESEASRTITTKGAKKVCIRKGSSSRKRFTLTLGITAQGELLKPHCLFSKLKNKPKVEAGCAVAVNSSGMFNEAIVRSYIDEIILSRPETALEQEKVLLLLDSYGSHIKVANSLDYEAKGVFIRIIPANLTSYLQPLDVVVNRSFQAHYSRMYDEYIQMAINDEDLQTRLGNPKVM